MKLLRLTTDNTLKRITKYAGKAPEGLENLPHSALIRMVREKLFMSQAQLAKRAGVSQSHLAKIEWVKKLNTKRVNFGKGKQVVVAGGHFDSKYNISVPGPRFKRKNDSLALA